MPYRRLYLGPQPSTAEAVRLLHLPELDLMPAVPEAGSHPELPLLTQWLGTTAINRPDSNIIFLVDQVVDSTEHGAAVAAQLVARPEVRPEQLAA